MVKDRYRMYCKWYSEALVLSYTNNLWQQYVEGLDEQSNAS